MNCFKNIRFRVCHVTVYSLPLTSNICKSIYTYMLFVNIVRRCSYKIEPDVRVTWAQARQCISLTMWNQVMFVLPISVAQCVWTPRTELPRRAPTLFEFVWQQYVALMIFDFLFYVWHIIHHRVPFLYRWVWSNNL
jgi:sterol desaturase/sphingolipid hydroxylase (fatty acid hydroxylase superfamily)